MAIAPVIYRYDPRHDEQVSEEHQRSFGDAKKKKPRRLPRPLADDDGCRAVTILFRAVPRSLRAGDLDACATMGSRLKTQYFINGYDRLKPEIKRFAVQFAGVNLL